MSPIQYESTAVVRPAMARSSAPARMADKASGVGLAGGERQDEEKEAQMYEQVASF
jgi:hypothetical protein